MGRAHPPIFFLERRWTCRARASTCSGRSYFAESVPAFHAFRCGAPGVVSVGPQITIAPVVLGPAALEGLGEALPPEPVAAVAPVLDADPAAMAIGVPPGPSRMRPLESASSREYSRDVRRDPNVDQGTSISGSAVMMSGTLQVEIQRWSTGVECQAFVSALATGQPEDLLTALRASRPPVGRLILAGPLLYGNDGNEPLRMDIQYATESRQPNGVRRINLLVVSVLPGGRHGVGPTDWVELEVQPDGTGKGTDSFACELGLNKEGNDIALRTPGNRLGIITLLK